MNELESLYQQIILDAARERYGEGEIAEGTKKSSGHGCSHQVNPSCGDEVTMQVQLSGDGERLEEIVWEGQGCSISQASISIMTEMLEGASVEEAERLYDTFKAMMESRGEELSEEELDVLEDWVGVDYSDVATDVGYAAAMLEQRRESLQRRGRRL